jgi:hypothetical protein
MRLRTLFGILLLGSAMTAACSDQQGNPVMPGGLTYDEVVDGSRDLTAVSVLQRLQPLDSAISVTAPIGWAGGKIEIPEAGLRVRIPAGALDLGKRESIDITVTALPGANVAYDFQPHGLRFREALTVEQDSRVTAEGRHPDKSALEGAYFPDPSLLGDGTAGVSEFRPTNFDVHGHRFSWGVEHFSGYLLASGRTISRY